MRLYLDDDLASPLLAQALRRAGHDVQLPVDVGLSGKDDSVHLAHASRQDRVILTRNYDDFDNLHNLVGAVRGRHPGILVVRRDDAARRNMKHPDIVRALANLVAAGIPISNEYINMNPWR